MQYCDIVKTKDNGYVVIETNGDITLVYPCDENGKKLSYEEIDSYAYAGAYYAQEGHTEMIQKWGGIKGLIKNTVKEAEQMKVQPFSARQIEEIEKGYKNGLTDREVKMYSNPLYPEEKMKEMRKSLEERVPCDYVNMVREAVFSPAQLKQVRLGIKHGLNQEQVQVFANQFLTHQEMKMARLALEEGCSIEQVKKLVGVMLETTSNTQKKPASINDRLDSLETGKKLTSVSEKENIVK